jgi:hypothetical protein
MQYTRVLIARVALGVASEDEVFWVDRCCKEGAGCRESVKELRDLATLPSVGVCLDSSTLVEIGDTNKVSDLESDHLVDCHRCARIGQYIANMPNPATPQKRTHMGLAS